MTAKKASPPEPRRRPTQARAQATVAAILEAAVRILRSEGRGRAEIEPLPAGISMVTAHDPNDLGSPRTARSTSGAGRTASTPAVQMATASSVIVGPSRVGPYR